MVTIASLVITLLGAATGAQGIDLPAILQALRWSSFTTALPFLLVFSATPLARLSATQPLGQWLQHHRRELWLILSVSHFVHLYQIWLYYKLGESCPLMVWLITLPLWPIMLGVVVVELTQPQTLQPESGTSKLSLIYSLGKWYIWLIFTLAFSLSTIAKHLLFYNLPAAMLFIAAAVLAIGTGYRRRWSNA